MMLLWLSVLIGLSSICVADDTNVYDLPEQLFDAEVTLHFPDQTSTNQSLKIKPNSVFKGVCQVNVTKPVQAHNGFQVEFYLQTSIPGDKSAVIAAYRVDKTEKIIRWSQNTLVDNFNVFPGDHVKSPRFEVNFQRVPTAQQDHDGELYCRVMYTLAHFNRVSYLSNVVSYRVV